KLEIGNWKLETETGQPNLVVIYMGNVFNGHLDTSSLACESRETCSRRDLLDFESCLVYCYDVDDVDGPETPLAQPRKETKAAKRNEKAALLDARPRLASNSPSQARKPGGDPRTSSSLNPTRRHMPQP
ncbi:hypothetical protein E4U54_007133, partial [Claviceps lovelessii]